MSLDVGKGQHPSSSGQYLTLSRLSGEPRQWLSHQSPTDIEPCFIHINRRINIGIHYGWHYSSHDETWNKALITDFKSSTFEAHISAISGNCIFNEISQQCGRATCLSPVGTHTDCISLLPDTLAWKKDVFQHSWGHL